MCHHFEVMRSNAYTLSMRARMFLFILLMASLPPLAFSQASPVAPAAQQGALTASPADAAVPGPRYAARYQTGPGSNGIANAGAPNRTVVADPSYPSTEQYTPKIFVAPNHFHFEYDRGGRKVDYFHNWGFSPTFGAYSPASRLRESLIIALPRIAA